MLLKTVKIHVGENCSHFKEKGYLLGYSTSIPLLEKNNKTSQTKTEELK